MKKVKIANFNNDWYFPGKNPLVRIIWFLINAFFFKNPLNFSSSIKGVLLRCFGARVGIGVMLKPGINIKYPWNLSIGNYSWIGEDSWLDSLGKIEIGNNVCISQGAYIGTGNHDFTSPYFDLLVKDVVIEDGVWIGAKAVVCPGVTCKSHSMLTVQSVAVHDLEAYTVYQGNPATAKRKRIIK